MSGYAKRGLYIYALGANQRNGFPISLIRIKNPVADAKLIITIAHPLADLSSIVSLAYLFSNS